VRDYVGVGVGGDVTESMDTIPSPFCGYGYNNNTTYCVELGLNGEDLFVLSK